MKHQKHLNKVKALLSEAVKLQALQEKKRRKN